MTEPLYTISIKEPWAWAILHLPPELAKDIENRSYPMPRAFLDRPVLIHTGKVPDRMGAWDTIEMTCGVRPPPISELHPGHIVGAAMFADCVTEHGSEWFYGQYGWTIGPRVPLESPVPARGFLKFWRPREQGQIDPADIARVRAMVAPPVTPVLDMT